MTERKHYLDNIRWITVTIVIIYHIIYMFNCSGVFNNFPVESDYPILDSFCVFVYPWFMCLLFIVSGISSRLSLSKRTPKEFIRDRRSRILLPSVCGLFIYGWIATFLTDKYNQVSGGGESLMPEMGDDIPGVVQYIIYVIFGIGPLWFAHIVFVGSLLLILVKKLDRNDKFWTACGKTNYPVLLLLTLAVWGSSFILNAPVIEVYRFGIYLFMFFLGYFVFSHDEVIEKLKKIAVPMGIIALAAGIGYTVFYYGEDYTKKELLKNAFTNIYLWAACLAILGLSAKYLNFSNGFTKYMNKNNFAFYVLHYTILVLSAYLSIIYIKPKLFAVNYIVMIASMVIILPLATEIIKRIPVVRKLILGISKPKKSKS